MAGDYPFKPADFGKLTQHSIEGRKSLVDVSMFARLEKYKATGRLSDLFPAILKGDDMRDVAGAISLARKEGRQVVAAIGAHVIKVGLAPILIDLMERKIITAMAVNGAVLVHDLEIAYHGATSEDVAVEVKTGRFGMVRETSEHYHKAVAGMKDGEGLGAAIGRYINEQGMKNAHLSVLASGWRLNTPVTAHVALGTDITHISKDADGAAIGRATFDDFKLFTGVVSALSGGVYLNIGSAVLLPEVFIKALSAARNMGAQVEGFCAVNMDMIQGYRPRVNVVSRPVEGSGAGYSITGHHEIMIPLLYHMLAEEEAG